MNRAKLFFRHVLLAYFDLKETASEAHRILSETYGEESSSERTCKQTTLKKSLKKDLKKFKTKKFADDELQALLDENLCQTLSELAKKLNVTLMCVSKRLRAMEKIQKEGKSK